MGRYDGNGQDNGSTIWSLGFRNMTPIGPRWRVDYEMEAYMGVPEVSAGWGTFFGSL